MDKLYSPAAINEIIKKHEFKISKSLGQNFLIDGNIVDNIIKGANIEDRDLVIEVGPGLGVLTEAAARRGAKVLAVEIDEKLIPILEENLKEYENVSIINEDFLKLNLDKLVKDYKGNNEDINSVKLIGNLPYYITSPIIMKVLESKREFDLKSLTVMMQKEVGDRIKAKPGSKAYGTLSIAVQYYCDIRVVSNVPRSVFLPKPKVDSIVLNLEVKDKPAVYVKNPATFFAIVKNAFGQRRKTLSNSLTGFRDMDKEKIQNILNAAGIDPLRRAETLDLIEFANIANIVDEQ